MPYLVEATIIPTTLFYVLLIVGDLRLALGGALMWSYGAVARRVVRNRPVPGLLILATIGITVRTIVYLLSSNDFVYFVGPIMRTTLTGLVFGASVVAGRPLIARFAGDFCPLTPDVSDRPGIRSLFKRLTFLWAGVNAAAAASSLALLLTVPVSVFVFTAAVSAWTITCYRGDPDGRRLRHHGPTRGTHHRGHAGRTSLRGDDPPRLTAGRGPRRVLPHIASTAGRR